MNRAMIQAADYAFLGGLMSAGNANIIVTSQEKLFLSLHVNADSADRLKRWLGGLMGSDGGGALKPRFERSKASYRIRVRFHGAEAIKVINLVHGRIMDPLLERKADLATQWWQTVKPRGIKMPEDQREKRDLIKREFLKLKAKTG